MKVGEVEIRVDNTEEVKAGFESAILGWLEAVGNDAAETAAEKAPVDTGRLKGSIEPAVVASEQAVYIGTNVKYAVYQELGTSKSIVGKHFLQFGATAHADRYKEILEQYLKG